MRVGRILAPVHTLGPGARVCMWTAGCTKHCPGCIAPELQNGKSYASVSVMEIAQTLLQTARRIGPCGLTLSGGDPLEQPQELKALLEQVHTAFADILVYTGYTWAELEAMSRQSAVWGALRYVDVLIEGRYEPQNNDGECTLRGSTNQSIRYINRKVRARYESYLAKGRCVQIFVQGDTVLQIGIPKKG